MEMNGATGVLGIQVENPMVQMLQNALNEAKAGRISSIAIVMVTPQGGVANPAMGNQFAELYVALGMTQDDIMKQIKQPRSPIVRATALG